MTDSYTQFANSGFGRALLGVVKLPIPPILERYQPQQKSFFSGNALIGAAPGGQLAEPIFSALGHAQATVKIFSTSAMVNELQAAAAKHKLNAPSYTPSKVDQESFKALVFDASGIKNSSELKTLWAFFQPVVRKLAVCGRVLVLGRPPELEQDPYQATAQRALEGFTRSVAKEIKKGGACQLLYVARGAEAAVESSLRFFLSAKSAYVSAQVVRIGKGQVPTLDWNKPLQGKVALVTGASRGIGAAIAEVLARDGAKLVLLDIPPAQEELEKVAQKLDGQALALDITAPDAPAKIAASLSKDHGGVDILVHNAGVTRDKTLGGMPEHLWDQVIDINLGAEERINAVLLEKKVLRDNGRIICVSSLSGIAGNFGQVNYGTSKAGVIGMVQAFAAPLAERGITINAVAPGFIETQMTAAIPFAIRELGRRMNAMSQGGLPVDVAEAIAYFASPASQGVSGNVLRVCGQSLLGA